MYYIVEPTLFCKHRQDLSQIRAHLLNRQGLSRTHLFWLDSPTDEKADFHLIDLSKLSSKAYAELFADREFSRALASGPLLAAPENSLDAGLALLHRMTDHNWGPCGTVVIAPKATELKLLDICLRRVFESFLEHHPKRFEALLAGRRVLLIRPAAADSMRCLVTGLTPDGRLREADHPAKHPQRILHAFQMATVENFPVTLNHATTDASFPSAHKIIFANEKLAAIWRDWKASPAKRRAES